MAFNHYYVPENSDKYMLCGIVEQSILRKEIRAAVSIIKMYITNVEVKWSEFENLMTAATVSSMVLMGSLTKDDAVPDETITGASPNITNEKVFILSSKAQELGLILDSNLIFQPTSENEEIYNIEWNKSIDNWVSIVHLFLKIQGVLYKIDTNRLASQRLSYQAYYKANGTPDIKVVGVDVQKSPGQLALNFPNTNAVASDSWNSHYYNDRVIDLLGDEYEDWKFRQKEEMITIDPPIIELKIVKITDITEENIPQTFAPTWGRREIDCGFLSHLCVDISELPTIINEDQDPREARKVTFSLSDSSYTLIGFQKIIGKVGDIITEFDIVVGGGITANNNCSDHQINIIFEPSGPYQNLPEDFDPEEDENPNDTLCPYVFSNLTAYALVMKIT